MIYAKKKPAKMITLRGRNVRQRTQADSKLNSVRPGLFHCVRGNAFTVLNEPKKTSQGLRSKLGKHEDLRLEKLEIRD